MIFELLGQIGIVCLGASQR